MAPAMLWRLLWAIIVVVVIYALIPPVTRVLGFTLDSDLMTILRIVIGALAVMYIIWGPHWNKTPPA
jgi:uncharacterized membrane protein